MESGCNICKTMKNPTIIGSCNHLICGGCFHRVVLSNFDDFQRQLKTGEKMKIKCTLCKKGNFSTTKDEVINLLKTKREREKESESKCEVHNKKFKLYCTTCKVNLCIVCTGDHSEDHNFEGYKEAEPKCIIHGEKLDLLCEKCDIPVCKECMKLQHDGHESVCLSSHGKKIKDNLINERVKKNKELKEKLDVMHLDVIDKLRKDHSKLQDTISDLIAYLQDFIDSYNEKLEKYEDDLNKNFTILSSAFENLSEDILNVDEKNYSSLYQLNSLPKEFECLNEKSNLDYNKLISKFKKIKDDISELKKFKFKKVEYANYENNHTLYGSCVTYLYDGLIAYKPKGLNCEKQVMILDSNKNYECVRKLNVNHSISSIIYTINGYLAISDGKVLNIHIYDLKNNDKNDPIKTLHGYYLTQFEKGISAYFYNNSVYILNFEQDFKSIRTISPGNILQSLTYLKNKYFRVNCYKNNNGYNNDYYSYIYNYENGNKIGTLNYHSRLCIVGDYLLENQKNSTNLNIYELTDNMKLVKTIYSVNYGKLISLQDGLFTNKLKSEKIYIYDSYNNYECVKELEGSNIINLNNGLFGLQNVNNTETQILDSNDDFKCIQTLTGKNMVKLNNNLIAYRSNKDESTTIFKSSY